MYLLFLAYLVICSAVIFFINNSIPRKSQYRPIPGPKGIPWLGPVGQVPFLGLWLKVKEWSDEYGPIVGVKLLGKQHIFVCSEAVANELLNKRGSIYSGRPPIPTIVDSQSKDGSAEYTALMSRNKYHTRQKKFNHIHMTAALATNFYNYPSIEAKRFIYRLTQDSSNWVSLCEDMSSRTVSRLTWGSPDYAPKLKDDAWDLLLAISPVGNLANLFTPLLMLPTFLSPWKRWEKKRHDEQQAWYMDNLEDVRTRMKEGRAGPSFAASYLSNSSPPFDLKEAAATLGMLSLAAVLTVSSPLHTFIRAAVLHPEWYGKVQEEVDSVCGLERMPEVGDSPKLPVLRAFIKECLRWRPPVPTGVSHELEQDDVYDGFLIPKGSVVHPVEWAFSLDPSVYQSPETFNPGRFLSPSYSTYREPLTSYPSIQKNSSFGWGRRTCQGSILTDHELLAACGGLAWALNLSAKEGDVVDGSMVKPHLREHSMIIVRPKAFGLVCKIRGEGEPGIEAEKRREVLERQYSESRASDILRGLGAVNVE